MIGYWNENYFWNCLPPFWIMKEELQEREIQNQIKKITKKKFFVFISCFEFSRSWSSLSIIQKSGKFKMNFGLQYPIIGICIEEKKRMIYFLEKKNTITFCLLITAFFKNYLLVFDQPLNFFPSQIASQIKPWNEILNK